MAQSFNNLSALQVYIHDVYCRCAATTYTSDPPASIDHGLVMHEA
jgi:hypothetical protein